MLTTRLRLGLMRAWLVCVVCLLAAVASARPKVSAADDAAVGDIVSRVLAEEYARGHYPLASQKLVEADSRCSQRGCRPETVARLRVAMGMIASQQNSAVGATENFAAAMRLHADVVLPERGSTPIMKVQWGEARKQSGTQEAAVAVPAAKAPTSNSKPAAPAGVAPAGWSSFEAFQLAAQATEAKENGEYGICVEKDKASLAIEEQPRTRLHLSSCEYRSGKIVDALRTAQRALEVGLEKRDTDVMRVARERVKLLIELIPHVTFKAPPGVTDLTVTFDGRAVPVDALSKKFSIDPGSHVIEAHGTVNGFLSDFEETIQVEEKELVTVTIKLTPRDAVITQAQIKCMLAAKTQDEVQRCIPQKRKSLVIHLGTDVSAYSDTNSVQVFSPGVNASLSSPTAGWNVGGNYLVDMVSAASPDIVSYASPPFREVRHAGGVTAGYKPGLYGAQVSGAVSREPDYLSRTVAAAVTGDFNDKLLTPKIGVAYTWDTIGRGPFSDCTATSTDDTGNNPCKRPFTALETELGLTAVMGPTTVLMVGGTLSLERGDQSKPYRHVPMFAPAVAPQIQPGQNLTVVDSARLSIRPNEQLPTSRDRYAIAARLIQRIGGMSTLRVEERLYYDTWQTLASTTDARYLIDIGRHFRVWPHVRLHAQTAANFYKLAYAVDPTVTEPAIPTYRTGDRELSPMLGATLGAGGRLALGNPEADVRTGITLSVDSMYNYYLNSLFIIGRTAIYGTLAFDVEF